MRVCMKYSFWSSNTTLWFCLHFTGNPDVLSANTVSITWMPTRIFCSVQHVSCVSCALCAWLGWHACYDSRVLCYTQHLNPLPSLCRPVPNTAGIVAGSIIAVLLILLIIAIILFCFCRARNRKKYEKEICNEIRYSMRFGPQMHTAPIWWINILYYCLVFGVRGGACQGYVMLDYRGRQKCHR